MRDMKICLDKEDILKPVVSDDTLHDLHGDVDSSNLNSAHCGRITSRLVVIWIVQVGSRLRSFLDGI